MSNQTRRQHLGLGKTAAGGSGGSFASHERSAASPPPAAQHPDSNVPTLSAEFSTPLVLEQLRGATILASTETHHDGRIFVEHRIQPPGEYARITSVTLDDQGNVAQASELFEHAGLGGAWFADEDLRDDLQRRINAERLAAIGIQIAGRSNDGGYSGNRFVGSRAGELGYVPDAAEVSKLVRKDVKRAVAAGALPGDVQVRVRTSKYSGGQSVRIDATVPRGHLRMREPRGLSEQDRIDWQRQYGGRQSKEVEGYRDTLEAIGNQWNNRDVDSMTDYHNVDYHLLVQFSEGDYERANPPRPGYEHVPDEKPNGEAAAA